MAGVASSDLARKGTPLLLPVFIVVGGAWSQRCRCVVLGVGSGREPIRAFMAHGIEITSVADATQFSQWSESKEA